VGNAVVGFAVITGNVGLVDGAGVDNRVGNLVVGLLVGFVVVGVVGMTVGASVDGAPVRFALTQRRFLAFHLPDNCQFVSC
jgi:hypothetical protein